MKWFMSIYGHSWFSLGLWSQTWLKNPTAKKIVASPTKGPPHRIANFRGDVMVCADSPLACGAPRTLNLGTVSKNGYSSARTKEMQDLERCFGIPMKLSNSAGHVQRLACWTKWWKWVFDVDCCFGCYRYEVVKSGRFLQSPIHQFKMQAPSLMQCSIRCSRILQLQKKRNMDINIVRILTFCALILPACEAGCAE